jgi:hypothetical protein
MRSLTKYISMFLVLALFGVTGCSSSSDSPTSPNGGDAPNIPQVEFKGPQTNSQDQHAIQTQSYVGSINGLTQSYQTFANLPAENNDNGWSWSVTLGNLTETLTVTSNGDNGYSWTLTLDGTDSDGTQYNNFTLAEGTTSGDGSNGSWTIYEDNSSTISAEFSWTTDSDNTLTGTLSYYDNGQKTSSMEVINYSDNSGQLTFNENGTTSFKSTWSSDGSGEWWEYDSQGNVSSNGTWS